MYGSWTENVELWGKKLGIVLNQGDVVTVHICSVSAQIQSLKYS